MTNVFGAMAYAYLADITTPEGRSKSFGAYMAAYGFAAIFGPTLSGYLEDEVLSIILRARRRHSPNTRFLSLALPSLLHWLL